MSKIGFAPIVGLTLAVLACAGILLAQDRVASSNNAQLTLMRTQNSLNQLQGIPWQVENPRFGSPAFIRALMSRTEASILASVGHLRQSAPATELALLSGPLKANFASLQRIYAMGLAPGGWTSPGPTNAVTQLENVSLQKSETAIANAGGVYARRVTVAKRIAAIGGVGTILSLLAAFFFYYRRAERMARIQRSTLAARNAAQERLDRSITALNQAQAERGRLLERTVEVAEHERIRLAMDLHDGPIQQLAVLALNLDRLARRISAEEFADARTLMADVRLSLSREMETLRRLMVELRPPILEEGGLSAALSDTAGTVLAETSIECTVHCEVGKHELAPELETAVYRIVHEALVNVRKHSQARRVDVGVSVHGNTLRLVIADDGTGFDAGAIESASNGKRYGLLGIHERIGGLGGTCQIESHAGGGTRIEAFMPLKVRKAEEANTHELAVA